MKCKFKSDIFISNLYNIKSTAFSLPFIGSLKAVWSLGPMYLLTQSLEVSKTFKKYAISTRIKTKDTKISA